MIIGLTGFKQTGKSTAAQYLEDNYGYKRVNFKDGLVAEIKQNFPDLLQEISARYYVFTVDEVFIAEDAIDSLFRTKPPLIRTLLQNYGTEVRRKDDPDYWVKKWKDTVQDMVLNRHNRNIVIDDVRFLNEANAVKNFGGKIIRIIREDITTGGTHQSETEMLDIQADHTIEAIPGQHDSLYKSLDAIVKNLVQ